jgi:ribose transport system ATP-binding protein
MLLECKSIQKRFGGITALRNGNLQVQSGEVHLVMGENGAGKSTLMKIVAGMQTHDEGDLIWKGKSVSFRTPLEASKQGIAMVHQESLLASHLTIAENLFLGRESADSFGFLRRREMIEQAEKLISDHSFPLRAQQKIYELSPAGRQLVEICRAILHGTDLLIFDEPTSSLSEQETHEVFRIVRTLKDKGAGVIYITHRLEELRSLGDQVTVLRDGATVFTSPMKDLSKEELIRQMVGRPVDSLYSRSSLPPGKPLLKVECLSTDKLLKNISLQVHAGEIVGMAGLIGAGRTELLKAIFGIDPISAGRIWIDGTEVKVRHPQHAVELGMALIPEDRQRTGLARELPVGYNMTLAALKQFSKVGFLDHSTAAKSVEQQISQLRIKTDGGKQIAGRLSGGNQQKVVIGKWLTRGAKIYFFDEPTRGIDIGAKMEVFEVMDRLAKEGAAVLMISSELPELLQVADRILVMRQGQLVHQLPKNTNQEEIMHYAVLEDARAAS